ncbi:MAG: 2Fe-2S iron-sulfur cluster-binding protein [Pseudomonadota bacterium]
MESGQTFHCAADNFIIDAAHAANVLIAYSCRSGQCGSCIGKVLQGEVSYPNGQPDALDISESKEGYALFCSAQPKSDLLIKVPGRGEIDF